MSVARARRPGKRADPRSDPRYRRVVDKLNADSKTLKKHPPPSKKSDESNKAAKGPANEKAAGARAKQVDKLEEAETPKPQTASFLQMLRAEIAKVMPKTLGDTEKFMKGGASGEIKGALKGEVANQKDAATGDLQQTSNAPPSEAGVPSKPVTPIPPEPNAPAPQVDAPAAMPAPKPDAEISLQDSKTEVGDARKDTKQTDKRLSNAGDPRFSAVMDADKAVQKQADAGPGKYRNSEGATLAKAAGQASGTAKKGVGNLLKVKAGSKTKVLSRQDRQKAKEELELKRFTDFVVTTFEGVKLSVDKRLARLEETVNSLFDAGTDAAIARMKSYVEDQLFQYKLDRYLLQIGGSLLWIRDQILDLPPEVNRFYEAGRKMFTAAMDALAERVANLVERELAAAKGEVSRAQGRIAAAQAALSPAVQARGAQVAGEYAEKFNELKSGIEDKKQQLAEGLAQKYKEAFDKADEALKAIQDENKGLVTKAKEKIAEVAKALIEFKNRLLAVLRKGADTIDLILDNPGGFLSNLLAAIKGGFSAFAGNILTHLKRGFVKWLFGAMAGTGVQIPSDLSLPSILKLVLGVLGITYERMRAKAVKLLGPTAVAVIEKLASYLMTLIGGGPEALWAQIKGDLSNLKEMVIGAIQDWIISTIVKKAVAKVVSMFNPVGAIIQAIMMIVNVVMFVIERAAQIMEFVESVVNSIHAIATGAIGGAIAKVEQALGNMVPILIGFLAALVGLGGIGAKIKGFILKVQTKVDQAIDKVLKKAVAFVKKLFAAFKAGVKKVLNWWKKKLPVKGGGEQHTLTFEGSKSSAKLVLRSTPEKPSVFMNRAADARSVSADARKPAITKTVGHEKKIAGFQKKLAKYDDNEKAAAVNEKANEADQLMTSLDAEMGSLSGHVSSTLESWGAKDGEVKTFSLPRSTFSVEHKTKIADQHDTKTDLRISKTTKTKINLRKGLARRHVVSSHDMSKHYSNFLKGKKWSAAKLLLEQRASIGAARTPVKTPLSQANIVDAASRRYGNFFGYAKNIFIGNSKENSSIQQHLDAGHPDMAAKQLRAHVRMIKRSWAIDSSMDISEL